MEDHFILNTVLKLLIFFVVGLIAGFLIVNVATADIGGPLPTETPIVTIQPVTPEPTAAITEAPLPTSVITPMPTVITPIPEPTVVPLPTPDRVNHEEIHTLINILVLLQAVIVTTMLIVAFLVYKMLKSLEWW